MLWELITINLADEYLAIALISMKAYGIIPDRSSVLVKSIRILMSFCIEGLETSPLESAYTFHGCG